MIITPTPTSPPQLPYAVLVEQQENGNWVAQVLDWAECWAEGTSRETTIAALKEVLYDRLSRAEVIYLNMPQPNLEHRLPAPQADHPLVKLAGKFKEDPYFDEMVTSIGTHRRELMQSLIS